MDLPTISFLFGAILVAVAILGGGFEIKEIKVPQVRGLTRIVAAVVGLLFLSIGIKDEIVEGSNKLLSQPSSPQSERPSERMSPESETWLVQFGVFKDRPNAELELRRLQNSGVKGLKIVQSKRYPGLQDPTASYLVAGPMSQSAASELIKSYTLDEPQPFVRNAFTPPQPQ
jgi:hypothetical protein